jgi:XTP/dITP diphosphohydrolase
MHNIVLATNNQGKVLDFQEIAKNFPVKILPQSDFSIPSVEETGLTFIENALIKARHAAIYTDYPVLADDSGLIVEDLNGAPGLYSARYAGENATDEENIEKLLSELAKIKNPIRKAKLYVVCVLMRHANDPAPIFAEGVFHGEILTKPQGKNGFGYLPIFYLPEFKCSAAELSIEQKNRINHRSQATIEILQKYLTELESS